MSAELGAILTAMVTPFDARGAVDEDAAVRLMNHLVTHGCDGLVVCGTTGEAATLTDEEQLGMIALAVAEMGERCTVIAGVGSNDTRHAVHLTERATELGADALLSVNPYYNRPSRRGIVRHYEEVARATDLPILLYNIPQRTGADMPNDLLAELAQLDNIVGVKQANPDNLAKVDGLAIYAGNDDMLVDVLEMGEAGGILVASHLFGDEMRRMVDEPERRREIDAGLKDVYRDLAIAPLACSVKAGLNLIGLEVGVPRLPYVELDEHETTVVRTMLERHGLLQSRPGPGRAECRPLRPRVLPLGGLGEIGKNMMVVEYEGRIVVVDTRAALPDHRHARDRPRAARLRLPARARGGHRGDRHHPRPRGSPRRPPLGAARAWRAPVYGGPLTIAMARSKLDEHHLRDVKLEDLPTGDQVALGPFTAELVHMTHSIPDSCAVALGTELGTVLVTGDYKFDQTPVDGPPADVSRLAELGREGVLLLCGDSTNADRPGFSPSERTVGPHLEEVFARAEGRIVVTSFASNIHRVQQVIDAAAALGRKVALVGRSMRKNVNIGRSLGHIDLPEGLTIQPQEVEDWPGSTRWS